MTRAELWFSTKIEDNSAVVAGYLANKRVLILTPDNARATVPAGLSFSSFFDAVITSDPWLFKTTQIDVFVCTDATPYQNHILRLDAFKEHPGTLFAITTEFVSVLNKAKQRLSNYVVKYDAQPTADLVKTWAANPCQLNAADLTAFMAAKGKHGVFSNLLSKNRDLLFDGGV